MEGQHPDQLPPPTHGEAQGEGTSGWEGMGRRQAWLQVPALALLGVLGQLLNLSEPPFLNLSAG